MAKAKVNIPWPHQALDHPVVYNWAAGYGWAGEFWERRRQKALNYLSHIDLSYSQNIPELVSLGERVKAVGEAERKKEISFIKHSLPGFNLADDEKNIDRTLIQKINEIINGEKQFKNAKDRISKAIELGKRKNKQGEDYKGLAPTMSAVFMSYLTSTFTEKMRSITKSLPLNQAVSEWKQNLDSIFEEAVDEAMKNMLEDSKIRREQDEAYGDSEQWKEIGEAYRQLEDFQRKFKSMLKIQLNIEELKKFFDTKERQKILQKTKKNKIKTGSFAEQLGWKSQALSNNIGGNVQEYIVDLVFKALQTSGNIKVGERGSEVVWGKVLKTDNIAFFSYEAEVNPKFNEIFKDFESEISDSISLRDAAKRIEDFYNENLANASQDNFYILTNTKMASLGSGFAGFHNGERQSLSNLGDYIEMAGMDEGKAEDFLDVVYNTLPTAIFEDKRQEVQDNIRNILTAAAARLLFDDWSTIGVENTGTQILNFFNLDGVIVPSSVFFINLGQAMIDTANDLNNKNKMAKWLSVYVDLPTTVVYSKGSWREMGSTNEEIKTGIWNAWVEQSEIAQKEAKFSSKFLMNFKTLFKNAVL